MPNPKHVSTGPPQDPATVPLLRRIHGDHCAQGAMTLPHAATATQAEMSVVLDAGHVGRVRIYYRRTHYKHYRNRFWTWIVERAEPAPGAELTPQATQALPRR